MDTVTTAPTHSMAAAGTPPAPGWSPRCSPSSSTSGCHRRARRPRVGVPLAGRRRCRGLRVRRPPADVGATRVEPGSVRRAQAGRHRPGPPPPRPRPRPGDGAGDHRPPRPRAPRHPARRLPHRRLATPHRRRPPRAPLGGDRGGDGRPPLAGAEQGPDRLRPCRPPRPRPGAPGPAPAPLAGGARGARRVPGGRRPRPPPPPLPPARPRDVGPLRSGPPRPRRGPRRLPLVPGPRLAVGPRRPPALRRRPRLWRPRRPRRRPRPPPPSAVDPHPQQRECTPPPLGEAAAQRPQHPRLPGAADRSHPGGPGGHRPRPGDRSRRPLPPRPLPGASSSARSPRWRSHTRRTRSSGAPYQFRELLGCIWREPLDGRLDPGSGRSR